MRSLVLRPQALGWPWRAWRGRREGLLGRFYSCRLCRVLVSLARDEQLV